MNKPADKYPVMKRVKWPSHIVEVYGAFNHWRWTLKDINGNIIGASTEGYQRRGFCLRNMYTVTGITVNHKPSRGGFMAYIRLYGQRATI